MNSALKRNVLFVFIGSFVCLIGFFFVVASSFFSNQIKTGKFEEGLIEEDKSVGQKTSGEQEAAPEADTAATSTGEVDRNAPIPQALYMTKITVWIGEENSNICSLTAGRQEGVRPGMIFNLYTSEGKIVGRLKIDKAEDVVSIGRIISDRAQMQGNYFVAQLNQNAYEDR